MRTLLLLLFLTNTAYAVGIRHSSHGIVFDTVTSLIWQDEDITNSTNWEEAIRICHNESLGGYNDWRLPNINELLSLVDISRFDPARREGLLRNGSNSGTYWTSTSVKDEPEKAWLVNFESGNIFSVSKPLTLNFYVRCVRGGGV